MKNTHDDHQKISEISIKLFIASVTIERCQTYFLIIPFLSKWSERFFLLLFLLLFVLANKNETQRREREREGIDIVTKRITFTIRIQFIASIYHFRLWVVNFSSFAVYSIIILSFYDFPLISIKYFPHPRGFKSRRKTVGDMETPH